MHDTVWLMCCSVQYNYAWMCGHKSKFRIAHFSIPWPSRCRRVRMSGGRGEGEGGNKNKSERLPLESIESTLVSYSRRPDIPRYVSFSASKVFCLSTEACRTAVGPGNPSVCVCAHIKAYTTNYNAHAHTLLMEEFYQNSNKMVDRQNFSETLFLPCGMHS